MALALGAHMSAAGGADLAITRAAAFQMDSCQLFTKNANQWNAKPLDPAVIERFLINKSTLGVTNFVVHRLVPTLAAFFVLRPTCFVVSLTPS